MSLILKKAQRTKAQRVSEISKAQRTKNGINKLNNTNKLMDYFNGSTQFSLSRINTNRSKFSDDNVALFGFITSDPTKKTRSIAAELGMPALYLKKLQPKLFGGTQERFQLDLCPLCWLCCGHSIFYSFIDQRRYLATLR